MKSTSDTIVEKFAIEWSVKNIRADFRIWQVIRRYVALDCVKVVWAGVVEPIEFANKTFSSCAYRDRGYVVCKRAEASSALEVPECTAATRIHRIAPYVTHSTDTVISAEDKREIGNMIDFLLNLNNSMPQFERIEDILIHQQ